MPPINNGKTQFNKKLNFVLRIVKTECFRFHADNFYDWFLRWLLWAKLKVVHEVLWR